MACAASAPDNHLAGNTCICLKGRRIAQRVDLDVNGAEVSQVCYRAAPNPVLDKGNMAAF